MLSVIQCGYKKEQIVDTHQVPLIIWKQTCGLIQSADLLKNEFADYWETKSDWTIGISILVPKGFATISILNYTILTLKNRGFQIS